MWIFGWKGPSGFSASSTAQEVTQGIDGTGLTAIVTGASSGIGLGTTRVLALRDVHVVMAVRNLDAGKNVREAILKEIPGAKIDVMELDLSSMASVRKFASEYQSSSLPLNLLINNAGVLPATFTLSPDNIELHFATNHLGHFLLTDLLLETMKKTARESNKEGLLIYLRKVTGLCMMREFSSIKSMMNQGKTIDDRTFTNLFHFGGYYGWYAYGQSKLANILHAKELARRLKEDGVEITANSLHPGGIVTNLFRHHGFLNSMCHMVVKYFVKTIPQGAATTCYVALHPQVKGVSGEYFLDNNIGNPSSKAKDADLAKKLWDFSLTLINPK